MDLSKTHPYFSDIIGLGASHCYKVAKQETGIISAIAMPQNYDRELHIMPAVLKTNDVHSIHQIVRRSLIHHAKVALFDHCLLGIYMVL